jgi:hypothetical protein
MHTRGGTVIDGHDVVLTQVRKQFQMMVGQEMPHSVGRDAVLSNGHSRPASPSQLAEVEQEAFECSP